MAEIISTICDNHLQSGEQVPGDPLPPIIIPDGRQMIVDLCEDCDKTLSHRQVLELAAVAGRPVESPQKTQRKKEMLVVEPEEERTCRWQELCGRDPFPTVRGRKRHEAVAHPQQLEEALEASYKAMAERATPPPEEKEEGSYVLPLADQDAPSEEPEAPVKRAARKRATTKK